MIGRPKKTIYKKCPVCGGKIETVPSINKIYCSKQCFYTTFKGKSIHQGYHFTEEQKKRMSEARKGFKHTEEAKRKISIGNTKAKGDPIRNDFFITRDGLDNYTILERIHNRYGRTHEKWTCLLIRDSGLKALFKVHFIKSNRYELWYKTDSYEDAKVVYNTLIQVRYSASKDKVINFVKSKYEVKGVFI